MNEIFADAFYFIAILNPQDQYHKTATDYTRNLNHPLLTTHWVLVELADALHAPEVRQRTEQFIRRIQVDPNITVINDFSPWFERGLNLYRDRRDKSWPLTDCISFSIMQERGIREALTADHHFEQAGFVALLSSKLP